MLSAVIITQNEERNIQRCLSALEGLADEIIVVDSGSTDKTEQICRQYCVNFVRHEWLGFAEQKNYANALAKGEWILSIDADEAVSLPLFDELLALKKQGFDPSCVYRLKRLTNFCGSWIHHCGWYPDAKIRLFQRNTARWTGTIHESIEFSHSPKVVTLKGDLLHYSYNTIDELASRQPKYYRLAAQEAFEKGKRCSKASLISRTCWTFLRDYLLKGGILDGSAGFTVCRMNAHYTHMKYATLRDLTRKNSSSCPK